MSCLWPLQRGFLVGLTIALPVRDGLAADGRFGLQSVSRAAWPDKWCEGKGEGSFVKVTVLPTGWRGLHDGES